MDIGQKVFRTWGQALKVQMKREHSEGNRDRALEGTPTHPPFQSQAQEIGEDACQKLPLALRLGVGVLACIPSYLLCLGLMGWLGVPSRARSLLPSECSLFI